MNIPPGALAGAFALVAVLLLALRRPLLALLGFRQPFKRPKQLVLIAVGLMVATAVITGAGVAGDSYKESFRDTFLADIGDTDVVLEGTQGAIFAQSFAEAVLADPEIRDATQGSSVLLAWRGAIRDNTSDLGEPAVSVLGVDPTSLRDLGGLVRVAGSVPERLDAWPAGGILVNKRLADKINAAPGDEIDLRLQPLDPNATGTVSFPAVVLGVVKNGGADPFVEHRPAAYASLAQLRAALGDPQATNRLFLDARGGIASPEMAAKVEAGAKRVYDSMPAGAERPAYRVADARTDGLKFADEQAEGFSQFMLTLGVFTILAGVLLIVTLMAMLVEERRADLATMRALGAVRFELTQLHLHEGLIYGLAAGLLGLATGMGLAYLIIKISTALFATQGFVLAMHYEAGTLLGAAGAGLALTILVVGVSTHRVARFNIAHGLRGEESPQRKRHSWRSWTGYGLLLLAGLAASVGALAQNNVPLAILGPPLALLGLGGLLVRKLSRELVYPILGGLLLLYLAVTFVAFHDLDDETDFLLMPLRGLLIVVASTLLLVYMDLPAKATAWLASRFRRLNPVADAALAYVRGRRTRTALTVAMIGLVVLILVVVSTVFHMFRIDPAQDGGGFDAVGYSLQPLADPAGFLTAHPTRADLDPLAHTAAFVSVPFAPDALRGTKVNRDSDLRIWSPLAGAAGVTTPFIQESQFEASLLAPEYATFNEALEGVRTHTDQVALTSGFYYTTSSGSQVAPDVGDVLTFQGSAGPREFAVVAIGKGGGYVVFAFLPPDFLTSIPGAPASALFIRAAAGQDPTQLAKEYEAAFQDAGMNAVSVIEVVEEGSQWIDTFLRLIQTFLGLGFVVGVASIGIVTARNVLERRREVGVLRALGAESGQILSIFTLEALFVVTLGVVIGFGGGLLVAYASYLSTFQDQGASYGVDWLNLGLIFAVAYVTAILAAIVPARRAGKIPPAQAIRYVE